MKARVACFLVPILMALVLLYQVLASLQIAVTHNATLLIIGVTLAIAAAAGLIAAIGPQVVRVAVLAACTLVFMDVTFRLSGVFEHLRPEGRSRLSRDEKRIADIHTIKSALDDYVARVGPLPTPTKYGEGAGPKVFWKGWWDLSSHDGNGDGRPFLEFLVDGGILPAVPVDPVNESSDDDPRSGKQYVYFLVPPDDKRAAGGACDARPNRWHYMLAITDVEDEPSRPPTKVAGSGCECLWRNDPNYFQQHFDYVLCGTYDVTSESLARSAAARAKRAADELAQKQAEATRIHGAKDRRRLADLLQIRQALQRYIVNVGPLPAPGEYGEAERSRSAAFWRGYWDVSTEDSDGDGRLFLDFLVESGTMASVPVDPDNEAAPDSDPRGGKQYVYFLVPPDYRGVGGSCVSETKRWVYLLGITHLGSKLEDAPKNIPGSGCDCLWRDKPDYFQQHFDYVVCGTFEVTPESRAHAAEVHARWAAAELVKKQAEAARIHGPQDQRRLDDMRRIRQGLQKYIATVGPLPVPNEYGEAEHSRSDVFWKSYWDVSTEDGDGDSRMFLDFLVEKGIMPSVPVDPDNEAAPDGDPRGGRQYVYFVVDPDYGGLGGSCLSGKKQWVYLLGITDLRSESARPPKMIASSGCDCLWRDQPDYFQQHFDYVICGIFSR